MEKWACPGACQAAPRDAQLSAAYLGGLCHPTARLLQHPARQRDRERPVARLPDVPPLQGRHIAVHVKVLQAKAACSPQSLHTCRRRLGWSPRCVALTGRRHLASQQALRGYATGCGLHLHEQGQAHLSQEDQELSSRADLVQGLLPGLGALPVQRQALQQLPLYSRST